MRDEGLTDDASSDTPITPELLADLQAGVLDDDTAARLWRRLRTDPAAAATLAALDRVRRDLAHLGADEASADGVPAAVSAYVTAALRAAAVRPPPHADPDVDRPTSGRP